MEFLNAIKSVMAAFVGVQKKKNLEEDFAKSSATPFIIAGLLMALVFVLLVYGVVQLVLS
ncbi:DUF2970 domain-containing protein [Leucothrix pacifica]|uniref:DUF2970 domain-containing protein n=1 Tax=Leucothrix pacifica TaxID=1247513 RepID=A0A317CKV5_9GAMM|nr:DUF2970 domain-containing protein [Leucothrix pacifica]PWQ99188.1 hypothetical protein DKW60_07105 [Leucothrix pacifica]